MTRKISKLLILPLMACLVSSCVSSQKPLMSADLDSPKVSSHRASAKARLGRGVIGKDKHGMPTYHSKQRRRLVRTTAYTHTESDHIKYRRMNAIGSTLRYGSIRSAAADWSVYPVGTHFRIKGLPYTYVVDDYGSALVGTNTIDLYKPSKSVMNRWGVRKVEIEVIKWGSRSKSLKLLKGRTRYSHCSRMVASLRRNKARFN